MKDFRQLQVWQKAHEFVLALYSVTQQFPKDELYGLTSQIRRASVSIPSNIAEGCGRQGDPELARFCQIAMGSASEVEYQLMLAHDLHYINALDHERLSQQLTELKRMLNAFLQKLKATL
ncbi:MAG: four helix bundle protein [Verrucomicrobiales bacterium]|nr:four helix bundle protein [Verrucomicrobiales bacterium]